MYLLYMLTPPIWKYSKHWESWHSLGRNSKCNIGIFPFSDLRQEKQQLNNSHAQIKMRKNNSFCEIKINHNLLVCLFVKQWFYQTILQWLSTTGKLADKLERMRKVFHTRTIFINDLICYNIVSFATHAPIGSSAANVFGWFVKNMQ